MFLSEMGPRGFALFVRVLPCRARFRERRCGRRFDRFPEVSRWECWERLNRPDGRRGLPLRRRWERGPGVRDSAPPRKQVPRLPPPHPRDDCPAAVFPALPALADTSLRPWRFLPDENRAAVRPACVGHFPWLQVPFSSWLRPCRAAVWKRGLFERAH